MTLLDLPVPLERDLLRDSSSRFARSHSPLDELRTAAGLSDPPGDQDRRQAAELGWFAMLAPAELGGGSVSGHGLADAAVIATERGAWMQAGTFTAANVAADTLAAAGTPEHKNEIVPALAAGEASACWAIADQRGGWEPGGAVRWKAAGPAFVLDGTSVLVEEAAAAQWILVTAGSPQGVTIFLLPAAAPGIAIRPLECLDITRRFYAVDFNGVIARESAVVGEVGRGATLAARQGQVAAVLTAADAVGAMSQDLETVLRYARQRVAFGRPIGSFQAVKHQLADCSLVLEASKAILAAAVEAEGTAEAGRFASVAKAYIGDAAVDLGQDCLQILGGIGFTWEHEHHLYMRRMATDAMLYGGPSWHRELLCRSHGLAEGARP